MQAAASGLRSELCYRRLMLNMFKANGALFTALLCLGLPACQIERSDKADADDQSNAEETKPPIPLVEPPLDRSRLLIAVARAASSHAAGADDTAAQRTLGGKQFEIRLRFGCDGQGPRQGDHGWSIDPDGRTLRVRAVPTLSLKDELVRTVAGEEVEAAGGFWLPRPWLLNAACPQPQADEPSESATAPRSDSDAEQVPAPTDPPVPALPRIGIAQFFSPEDARTGRRMDRPFEAVKQLKEGDRAPDQGFNLVVAGRLIARGDGRVVLCAGSSRDRPPDCVVSADIDRVWIEQPENKAVVAEWSL